MVLSDPEEARLFILKAFLAEAGNFSATARRLEVTRMMLWLYMKRLGIALELVDEIRASARCRFRLPAA